MIKFLIKLAIAALIVNAVWRLGSAYMTFYRFRDAVEESARFSGERSSDEVRQGVMQIAGRFELPLSEGDVAVTRDGDTSTSVQGEYRQPIRLLPWYEYPWSFRWNLDVPVAKKPSTASDVLK